jgi:hypothetical protein
VLADETVKLKDVKTEALDGTMTFNVLILQKLIKKILPLTLTMM